MAVKHYCDHCGQELDVSKRCELDDRDFIDATWEDSQKFYGYELCEACYDLRLRKHLELDLAFFGVREEKNNEID